MAWTDEMVEELKKLWAEGVTTGEIGKRLNISKNSIVGKVHRLGLSGRPSPIKKKSDTPKAENITKPTKEKKPAVKVTKEAKIETKKASKKETLAVTKNPEVNQTISQNTSDIKATFLIETASEEDDIKLAKTINHTDTPSSKTDRLSLVELDNHTCRWPIGDPKDENFHFCGKKIRLGQTYCEEHASIAYVKPNKK